MFCDHQDHQQHDHHDGGSAKLSYCSEREGVTNNNDLGRRNPWRSGRQEEQCASSQHTINKIFSMEADNINASFPPGWQLTINKIFSKEADNINASFPPGWQLTINKIFPKAADNINASFPPGGGVLDPSLNNNVQHSGEQEVVTLRELPGRELPDPWFPGFGRRGHGGARGRQRRGNPPFGREEKTTKRAEPNFAPPQLVVFSGRK